MSDSHTELDSKGAKYFPCSNRDIISITIFCCVYISTIEVTRDHYDGLKFLLSVSNRWEPVYHLCIRIDEFLNLFDKGIDKSSPAKS